MDYINLRNTAQRLIRDNGKSVSVCVQTVNYTTGAYTDSATTVYAVEVEYNLKEMDGTSVQQGDRKLILSALNSAGTAYTAPALADRIKIGSEYFKIVLVYPISPGNTTLLYEVFIRG